MTLKEDIERVSNWKLFEPNRKIILKKGIYNIDETIYVSSSIIVEGEYNDQMLP